MGTITKLIMEPQHSVSTFPDNQLGELLVIQIHPTLSIKIRIDAFGL
jgi:hypothetical protein